MSGRGGLAGFAAVSGVAALLLSTSLVSLAQGPSPSAPVSGASPSASTVDMSDYSGLPGKAVLRDGTEFKLAKGTAKRIAQRKPLTVYLSAPTSADARFQKGMTSGFDFGVDKSGQSFLPMKGRSGSSADATSQAADITAQVDSGKVDCLVVWPARAGSLADSVNHALAAGVPVVNIGYPAGGNEFADPVGPTDSEGVAMADQVMGWMGADGHPLHSFAFATADSTDPGVQTRITDFVAEIAVGVAATNIQPPGPTFVTPPGSPLVVSADPATAVSDYRTYLAAHPEVDLIAVMDGTAAQADQAIADAGLTGKVHTVGLTLDSAQLDAMDAGIQIAIVQADWSSAAVGAPIECGQLLVGEGVTATGVPPLTWGVRNTDRGRSDLTAAP